MAILVTRNAHWTGVANPPVSRDVTYLQFDPLLGQIQLCIPAEYQRQRLVHCSRRFGPQSLIRARLKVLTVRPHLRDE
jgi:hypothetical protein